MTTSAVYEVLVSEDGVYGLSIDYDPEHGMLASFAALLHEYARCVDCGAPPQGDFGPCPCDGDHSFFNWRLDHTSWESMVKPLLRKDWRRAYGRRTYELRRDAIRRLRRDAIRDSDEPAYSASDVAWLRKIQNDTCYYCGVSILTNAQVEHLEPLAKGGFEWFPQYHARMPFVQRRQGCLERSPVLAKGFGRHCIRWSSSACANRRKS